MKIDKITTDDDLINFLLDQHKQTCNPHFMTAAHIIERYRRAHEIFSWQLSEYNWISMDDDKPKKNGYYLCWYMKSKCGNREEWQIDKLYWEDNLWLMHHNTFKTVDYVTHWMRLPVPPGHVNVSINDVCCDKFGFWTLKED